MPNRLAYDAVEMSGSFTKWHASVVKKAAGGFVPAIPV
jgi:hypothetical protein